jgi:hypothetical protein
MQTNTTRLTAGGVDRLPAQAVSSFAGARLADLYLEDIAAAGLESLLVQGNPGYHFASERAQRTSDKYGAHTISLLALKPVRASRHTPARIWVVAPMPRAGLRRRVSINTTTMTEEVFK